MTKIVVMLDCGHGCPPIHMTLPVDEESCSAGHVHLTESERGRYLAGQGMKAHLIGVHGE